MTFRMFPPPTESVRDGRGRQTNFLVRCRSHRAQLRERVNGCWDVMFPRRTPLQTGEEQRR